MKRLFVGWLALLAFALLILILFAPRLWSAPAIGLAVDGQSVTILVTADGTAPFTYQWMKAGAPLPGATSASYLISPVRPADAGVYTVKVSNAAGAAVSDTATLTVNAAPPVIRSLTFTVANIATGASTTLTVTPGTKLVRR